MLKVGRLIKGSVAALAVVAGGATGMTIAHVPSVATTTEITNNANRFSSEFAPRPATGIAANQSFTSSAGANRDRPISRTAVGRHAAHRLIDTNYPFAAVGWQRSLAAAAHSLSQFDGDEHAFGRGCVPCRTAAGRRGAAPQG